MALQELNQKFPITDPKTGQPSEYFLTYLRSRGGFLTEVDQQLATLAETIGSRQVIAGSGLTGGGPLSADVTLNVGSGTGITVNSDDIALADTAVTPGSYTNTNLTVDAQGRLTAASNGESVAYDGARVSRTSTSSNADATTALTVSWPNEDYDTNNYFTSGSPTIFTIPNTGYYDFESFIPVSNLTAGSWARTFVAINGVVSSAPGIIYDAAVLTGGITTYLRGAMRRVLLTAGDTVAIQYQVQTDTTTAVGQGAFMEIRKVR